MQAVILAAGKGSRLHPITTTISKAMLPILGKPIVERVIENIVACGLRDFILVISPDDHEIRDYFGLDPNLEFNLQFVYQPERLGMADALKKAVPLINEEFLLSACDNLVSLADTKRLFSQWMSKPDRQGLLTLIEVPEDEVVKSGVVTLEGDRVTSIVEKPPLDQAPTHFASMPLYCFSTRILDLLPQVQISSRGEYELQDAIQMLIEEGGDVRGLFFQKRFALTNAVDLLEINKHFLDHSEANWQNRTKAVGSSTQLLEPLFIEEGAVIGSECKIGPNVYIGRNVRIGNNIRLRDVVVLNNSVISDNREFTDCVVSIHSISSKPS
jgi:NDP-sugar pyrophosphorylase family protein